LRSDPGREIKIKVNVWTVHWYKKVLFGEVAMGGYSNVYFSLLQVSFCFACSADK